MDYLNSVPSKFTTTQDPRLQFSYLERVLAEVTKTSKWMKLIWIGDKTQERTKRSKAGYLAWSRGTLAASRETLNTGGHQAQAGGSYLHMIKIYLSIEKGTSTGTNSSKSCLS